MNTIEELKTLNPCFDGFDYARQFTTLKEAWDRCERSDWMWWFVRKILPFTKECAVKYAHRCAEHVKDIKNNDATNAADSATMLPLQLPLLLMLLMLPLQLMLLLMQLPLLLMLLFVLMLVLTLLLHDAACSLLLMLLLMLPLLLMLLKEAGKQNKSVK